MTKIFALFLPQFHADPYNDEWWEKGFTEWTNVRKAKPLFDGHYQPRIPRNGYQSLETPDDIHAQFTEAKEGGLDGFVFYHYWSMGTRLLRKPLDILLENPHVGAGSEFSLCWANHSWTRSWKNRSGAMDVLLEQSYEQTVEEMSDHVDFLISAFEDPRYTRINGDPLLFVYRPEDIPNIAEFNDLLRARCLERLGCGCHLSSMITNWRASYNYLDDFDSATLTQPAAANNAPVDVFRKQSHKLDFYLNPKYVFRNMHGSVKRIGYYLQDLLVNNPVPMSYDDTWQKIIRQISEGLKQTNRKLYFGSFVDFDNTARYGNRARYYTGFTPEKFAAYMSEAYGLVSAEPGQDFFLINAWNEWAEGMHLQPDEKFGDARLDAVRHLKTP